MDSQYTESQTLKSALMWIVLSGLLFFSIFATLSQVIFGIPVGNNPMPNWGIIALTAFSFILIFLTISSRLHTTIDTKFIKIYFPPLGGEEIAWKEVKSVKMAKLNLISVGRRYSKDLGHIYNAGGKEALSLELKNGRKVLVSTRNPEQLRTYLKRIKKL